MISYYPELKNHSRIFNQLINQYISLVNQTLSSKKVLRSMTPGQHVQIHVINEHLATLKISTTSFLEYTRLIIEFCEMSKSEPEQQDERYHTRLSSVFIFGNNLGSLVSRIKTDLEEINTQNITSVADMLRRIEEITCNFTSAVNETAQRSKECYDNLRSARKGENSPLKPVLQMSYFGRN